MNLGQPSGLTKTIQGSEGFPREGGLFWRAPWKYFMFMAVCFASNTKGPKMITHTFYHLGINFSIAQAISYTGLAGRNRFV